MIENVSRRKVCASAVGLTAGLVSIEVLGQGRPIRIGASLSLTGTLAQSGDKVKRAYELWATDVNGRGGLLGRPVEFLILDDRSDAGTSARLYEKLITQDKVDLVIGPYGSAASFAATAVTEKYRYPMLLPSAASDTIFTRGYKYIFQLFPPSSTMFEPLFADIGAQAGYRRVAIINGADLYGKSVAANLEALARKHGRDLVLREEFPLDASDLSSLMLKLRSAKPDLIAGATQLPDAILIMRQLRDMRVLPKAIALTPGAAKDDFGQALGRDADGVMLDHLWEPVDQSPQGKAFTAKWKSAYRDDPDAQSAFGWSGGQLLEAAVKSADSLEHDKLREAFLRLEATTLLPGKFKLDPGTGRQTGQRLGIAQWQKGTRQIVSPQELATAPIATALAEWSRRG
ncbi:MAG: amino acid ABC transporter substrate-binding protein [Lautropia sp.]